MNWTLNPRATQIAGDVARIRRTVTIITESITKQYSPSDLGERVRLKLRIPALTTLILT
ncbi:hypothetical protein OAS06_02950 [Gammaproteobacteria bacterium]|nr:hypothetical protein [Gammaproteobacteria bacterium]